MRSGLSKSWFVLHSVIISIALLSASCRNNEKLPSFETKVNETYTYLDKVLTKREANLLEYLNEVNKLAKSITKDEMMVNFFKLKNEYYQLSKGGAMPQEIVQKIEKLKRTIHKHYLLNYMSFNDLLFINAKGDIFYTIRKDADYHRNIFDNVLSKTLLSKKLKENADGSFIDFHFYEISGEPTAFFIEPVYEQKENMGWIVMLFSINKIDKMFNSTYNMGQTGEVILVNKDDYMLTNSRFKLESTILKQHLPEESISKKFKEKHGHSFEVDYRGKEVYCVFDVFNFLNSQWLIITKIDRRELVNSYFMENEDMLYPYLETYFKNQISQPEKSPQITDSVINVEMDEFQRADSSQTLFTQGIASCTAINIAYPGHFDYLSHISSYDVMYNESRTDLMLQVFKQISYFEITGSQKDKIRFQVASTNPIAFMNILNEIIYQGFYLDQVKMIYNPDADYGNMYSKVSDGNSRVNWYYKDENQEVHVTDFDKVKNVESLLLNIGQSK